jgi:hypothetical protein
MEATLGKGERTHTLTQYKKIKKQTKKEKHTKGKTGNYTKILPTHNERKKS